MIKVFDCSNSAYRQPHRMSGGPVQNDVMRQLALYAGHSQQEFVNTIKEADVIITNDVFPPQAISSEKPLVKRMDGVFFQNDLASNNDLLNAAAQQADAVIFISNFSENSLHELYPDVKLKRSYVALNAADHNDFVPCNFTNHPRQSQPDPIKWACAATRWDRPEKRFDAIFDLLTLRPQDHVLIIGDSVRTNHPNISCTGYLKNPRDMAVVLRDCDAFFHPAYRDAAPKTVAQALASGLPVLAAASGGLPELVTSYGVLINESTTEICSEPPRLSCREMSIALKLFTESLPSLSYRASKFPAKSNFHLMLGVYYWAIEVALRDW